MSFDDSSVFHIVYMFIIPKIENIYDDSTEISFFIFNAVNLFYKHSNQ